MGSPAKLIRELRDEEVRELYNSAKRYVSFKDEYLEPDREYNHPKEDF
jgi:carbonic anhydrase/acetyltransferase-like protein (isoleucine patch superfamily)